MPALRGTHPQEDSAIRPRDPASSHAQRKPTPGQRLAPLYHVRVEKIRKLTTETIYRKQLRPVIVHGADVMDRIFPGDANPLAGADVMHRIFPVGANPNA